MDGGGFAFNGGIGSDDDLVNAAVIYAFQQRWNPQLLRTYAVQRRDSSVQHVIDAVVRARLLDGSGVRGFFHDRNQALVAGCAGTIRARAKIRAMGPYTP